MFIDLLYEDNHLLVLNKPSGILTQPSGTEQESLEEWGKRWIKEKYQKPGNVFLQAAHRIDKPVSGIVVFAKTSKAISRLNQTIREKAAQKKYLALVEGIPANQEAILEHYLIHDDYCARLALPGEQQGKHCRLHYKMLEKRNGVALLEITLETGRYHQIRCQLSALGLPIIGDFKYGSKRNYLPSSICLHHSSMKLPHPTKGELLSFHSPTPSSWPILFT